MFHEFDASYIDVRGDGVFALFNKDKVYNAIVAAITFKTFSALEFVPLIKKKVNIDIGCHIGIDQKTVLVRKIGLKRKNCRSDRQNEIWAGRPINMASKLASKSNDGELIVSDRFFKNLESDLVLKSCGCNSVEKENLWVELDVSNERIFDFNYAYMLKSYWCSEHGKDYCNEIIKLDC
ncbi:MAG: hypothetical protein PHQ32_06460 [Firmicutes bacterium]|nr:hypothetical protein [Bacillota bacterium]